MSTTEKLSVAVIGCGRMGRLHARCYSQLAGVELVGVHDRMADSARETATLYGTEPFEDPDALLDRVRAVSIATPTMAHVQAAEPFLRRGIACLIEKPMACSSNECQRLVDLAEAHGAVVQIGHIERFNPIVVALQKLDLAPQYVETTRISPMTFRSIDVGVVLDMMIHDIDIVLSLIKSPPVRVESSGAAVLGSAEDACTARVTFENGAVANLSASRLAMKTDRRLRLYSRGSFVSIDYAARTGIIVNAADNVTALRETAAKVRDGEFDPSTLSYPQMVKTHPLTAGGTEPIRAELEAFIDAVRGKSAPAVSAQAGLANVALAEEIVAAMSPRLAV